MTGRRAARRTIPRQAYVRWVVLAMCAVLYCWVAVHLGLERNDGAPDELMRALIPQCIINGNLLPSGYDQCAIYEIGYWSYAFYPQMLGAYVSAAFMAVFRVFGADANMVFMAGRFGSVVFGLIAVHCIGRTTAILLDSGLEERRHPAVWPEAAAMTIFGFWPQVVFLSSYMNNDIVALAGVAMLMYALAAGIRRGWTMPRSLALAAGVIVCVLGYANAYGFVLAAVIAFIGSVLQQQRTDWKRAVQYIGVAAGVAALAVLPFLAVNVIRYGDPLGMSAFHERYAQWVAEHGEELQHPWTQGLRALLFTDGFVQTTYTSFIGELGWMTLPMPFLGTLFYSGLMFVGLGIAVPALVRSWRDTGCRWLTGAALLGGAFTVFLHLYYVLRVDYQAQGRYVIYLLVPLVLAGALGLGRAMPVRSVPGRIAVALGGLCYAGVTVAFFMSTANAYGWAGVTGLA